MRTVQLVGGPADGQTVQISGWERELVVPVPDKLELWGVHRRPISPYTHIRTVRYTPIALPSSPGFRFWYASER